MANLAFYKEKFGILTEDQAFEKFTATLQNYYNAGFYVDWKKVELLKGQYEREYALLTTLCNKPDKKAAARSLLLEYPQIIPALPRLMGCRGSVSLVEDSSEARVVEYDFVPLKDDLVASAERYAAFIEESGLIELLDRIASVSDYMTGVEVGMDSNARKNRGGRCGVDALMPSIERVRATIPSLRNKEEASYVYLQNMGFNLPADLSGITWDFCFWLEGVRGRLVVMEVNHYGSSGSKPSAIAREYAGRQSLLKEAGIGFIWVTDGLGWREMRNPLREAFQSIDHMVNIKLATEGQLEDALKSLLDC